MLEWFNSEERKLLDQNFGLDFHNGKNPVLDNYMIQKRNQRPCLSPTDTHVVFQNDDYVQFWFQTPPCRFSESGKCTICNYWSGKRIPGLLENVLKEYKLPESCDTFILNTCGSCLDPTEISDEDLMILFKWLAESNLESIIFETHWSTLTEKMLKKIHDFFPDKEISYEIGIESANMDTLFYCLNKPSSIKNLSPIIERIHKYNASCIMNVIFGTPFLTPSEQIKDAFSSVKYLLNHDADYIVVFPVNIKKYTLLTDMYDNNEYVSVPIKAMAEFFLRFPENVLNRINVAWFGDHEEKGVIPPAGCSVCRKKTIQLFKNFNSEKSNVIRKKILQEICEIDCNCVSSYIENEDERNLYSRIFYYYKKILGDCKTP